MVKYVDKEHKFSNYEADQYSPSNRENGRLFADEFLKLLVTEGANSIGLPSSKLEEQLCGHFRLLLTIGFCEGAKQTERRLTLEAGEKHENL